MRSMAAAGGAFAVKSRTTRATGRPCTTSGAFATPIGTVGAKGDDSLVFDQFEDRCWIFLDGPASVCYCFSELTAGRRAVSCGPGWRLRFGRNEKGVKPLKTNNCAKWPISHPQ
jgi:hypothetical protein